MRIVSLLPAATEIVCALGLREQLVGRSHECDFPEDVAKLPTLTRSRLDSSLGSEQIDSEVRKLLARLRRAASSCDAPPAPNLAPSRSRRPACAAP